MRRKRIREEEYAHQSAASHSPVIEMILAERGAYYTRELLFSPSTAMKSHPHIIHECVLYVRFYGK